MRIRLLMCVLLSLMMVSAPVMTGRVSAAPIDQPAAAGDEYWSDRFGLPGVSYRVNALASTATDVYVGGGLLSAAGLDVNGIARWDGQRFHALGTGVRQSTSVAGVVYALATHNDKVYVGGEFTLAGSTAASNIAVWNGTTWSALGSGTNGPVYALAVDAQGTVYAGGYFEKAGGVTVNSVARWNGTNWSALGGGITTFSAFSPVYALAVSGSTVYVGGEFDTAGETAVNSIAQWNGTNWATLGEGLTNDLGFNGRVNAIEINGNSIYVGGNFATAGTTAANRVAVWNGSSWSALGGGIGSDGGFEMVYALEYLNGRLYAGGDFLQAGGNVANRLACWNGSAWQAVTHNGISGVGNDFSGQVLALGAQGTQLFVGGEFDLAGELWVNHVARWDAASAHWWTLGQGTALLGNQKGLINALAVNAQGHVYVGGWFDYAGGVPAKNIARWDGTRWWAVGGGTDWPVNTIEINGADVFVGGSFSQAGGLSAANIARWNETTQHWSALGSGASNTVWDIDIDGNLVYVGGDFTSAGGVAASKVARWNRTSQQWSAIGTKALTIEGSVRAVYGVGSTVFVGGIFGAVSFSPTQTVPVNSVVYWDGVNGDWYKPGDGVQYTDQFGDGRGFVYDLLLVGSQLYVAGDFDKAGGSAAVGIARWNISTGQWSPLGSGLGGGLNAKGQALASDGGSVYVGGDFRTAGSQTANTIARWNIATNSWSVLGSGLGLTTDDFLQVEDIDLNGGDVWLAGQFIAAGGAPASSVARWSGTIVPPPGDKHVYLPLMVR